MQHLRQVQAKLKYQHVAVVTGDSQCVGVRSTLSESKIAMARKRQTRSSGKQQTPAYQERTGIIGAQPYHLGICCY